MTRRGFDVGTYNLVCCHRNDKGDFVYKREVNAFLSLPLENDFVFNMMKMAGVPLIHREDANIAYALGEAAVNMAYTMNQVELKRPMKDGCVNPKEQDAFQIMNIMVHSLLDEVESDGEILCYCVPSNAINESTDADYHQKIIEAIFKAYKSEKGYTVDARPINEGMALVYAELKNKMFTGVGVSCLCPGTKIYTKDGIKNIEDVKIGDLVLTHKGRWRPVNNVVTKEFDGLQTKIQISGYTNKTDNYKFVDNHELYVYRNNNWEWVGCDELEVGDIVGEPIEKRNPHGKTLGITICERKTSSKEYKKTRVEVTADVWRLLGYFLADGSVNDAEGCINFDFANHEEGNISDVQNILKKNFNKESALTKHGDNCTRVKCYSRGMCSYFRKFYNESKEKCLPWTLERLTNGDCLNLLAGLIRGDGSISDDGIRFENTSTSLVLLAKQLFSRIGAASSISYSEPRSHESRGRIIEGKKLFWKVNSGSKTTHKSLCEIISNINCSNSIFSEKIFLMDGMCCGRIQKIDHDDYSGIVYDLQVEEDHSFSGPMLTIHNCGGGMINVAFSLFGAPVFTFAIVNSGDWIDKQSAQATGESIAFINKEKTKIDLNKEPTNLVERAIKTQYELMIEKTVLGIKKGFENNQDKNAKLDTPVDFIVAGGTASPPGFDKLFEKLLRQAKLPVEIGKVVRPADPLFSVARGCLIAAENAK